MAQLIAAVRVHRVTREMRGGRAIYVKRRWRVMDLVIIAGNWFLDASRSGVRMFPQVARWQRWELQAFALLHAPDFACGRAGLRSVWLEEIPGRTLREHAVSHELDVAMVEAAGRELRRAHALQCPQCRAAWSHGDPHLGNFLYDPNSNRARLIDFECAHTNQFNAQERLADDLLVFLLELMGRTSGQNWRPCRESSSMPTAGATW